MTIGNTNIIAKDMGEGSITILPWAYSGITQGTWAFLINSAYSYNGYWYNSTAAVNDQIDYKVWLSKGHYAVGLLTQVGTTLAQTQVLWNGVLVGAIDPYAPSSNALMEWLGLPNLLEATSTGLGTLSLKALTGYNNYQYVIVNAIGLSRVS